MNHIKIKSTVGVFVIVSHVAIIFYIFILTKDVFFLGQAIDLTSIIAPLFTAYTVSITKSFINRADILENDIQVGFNYIFVSFFYPLIFTISLFVAIYLYQIQSIQTFENLKKVIGIIEISFGLYFGMVIDTVFSKDSKSLLNSK